MELRSEVTIIMIRTTTLIIMYVYLDDAHYSEVEPVSNIPQGAKQSFLKIPGQVLQIPIEDGNNYCQRLRIGHNKKKNH